MLIRLNVDKVRVAVRLWGCVMGKPSWGPAAGGTSSSPISPTSYVISVGHEGDQLESWKFLYICKKGH